MSIPFKKYGYTINPITDEIKTPQVFLVNKRLQKVGELYPVENLSIKVNEVNQPDEASFTYHKEKNGEKSPYFNEIDDLSVIQVGDFGFFECSVSKNQNASILKTVTAKSLGYAELSQTLHTLEVNTEDDMKRSDYDMDYPTIFYREIPVGTDEETARKLRESSLFHRILTEAPNYKIGHVDTTLWYVQRTFSWSDTDIVSIFNEVEKEIGCIFDIQVRVGDDGEVERIVNAYDMQYCSHCWEEAKISGEKATSSTSKFRNIVNGVCQNCGESKYIKDIGDDSGIYISTDNLSDDISINGDPDSIKNCLKITGGDDVITATVQGLNMSASGKIMAFSDLQKKAMSPELKEKLDTYNSDYKNNIVDYEALLETEYNMQDIRLYLQSGKMPQIEKEIKTTDEALYSVLSNIVKHFNKKFYISSYKNYYKYPTSSARTSINNMFTTFMPEGFSMTIDKSSSEEDVPGKDFDSHAIYGWYGTVKVYSTGNRDDSYTLHITKSNGTYVTSGTSEEHYISSDASIQSMVDNFRIQFYFADQTQEEYKEYLEQYTAYLLSTVDLTYENEQKKEWDKYGYNLLKSYADGYQKCIETIDDMLSTADGESQRILNETREKYVSIQSDILLQMNVLEDQIFAICRYLGGSYDDSYLNDNGEISYNYKYYKDDKKATIQEIFDHMINPDYVGGYNDDQTVYTPNEYIGDKPFKCLKCNSSNVVISTDGNVCRNNGCGAKGSDIYTYRDMMKNIADSYREHSNSGKTIVKLRTDYRNQFDMKTYLGDTLYIELRSFIREDVYNNSNFTSDGLSNAQIIEQAKELKAKAEQELAKACNPQYFVATSLSSVVAQKEFVYKGVKVNDDYSKFMINNYVRVLIDEVMYKMRITSIDLKFPITDKIEVTFSNVTNCKTNTAMNVKEILDSAASIATSYDYVATQADKGAVANDQFANIMNEGLNASLMAVKNSRDQDVVIDNHGILLRKKIHEMDEYSPYQMKLINRNIVMTDDNWNTAKMAIGLGMYEGVERYGVWADVICGNLLCGNKLAIYGGGDGTTGNATVIIDGNGITLDGGAITWKTPLADGVVPQSAVSGLPDTLKGLSKDIEQLDGRIQTYSQSDDPSTSWNEDEKSKHKGDIWFNPSDGLTKRWDGTKWNVVTDSNLVVLAQSKGQIFTTQPTPPYNVGDLWIGNNESDLLRCQTPKKSGEKFDIKDWIVGVKYTDDSALDNWKDDFTSNIRPTIEKQIDEKADTWYSSTDPSLNWNNDDRKNHVGDLWYKTIPDSNGNYHTYIYNSSYKWEEVNGVPKEVFDMADGKASIYISKPTNGYKAKDLWILDVENADGNNIDYPKFAKGTLLTATTSSSNYNKSHWDEKVKYSNSLLTLHEELQGYVDDIFDDLQKQIDGEIVSWFYDYAPTLNNLPASEWKTKDEQIKHEGDLFYDTSTGIAYRFIYDDDTTTHKWIAITDAAITEALSLIATAQATADSKCKTFYSKPINGYDDGDIWILSSDETLVDIKYSKNTILTAILPTGVTSRTEFVAGDWVAVTTKSAEKALGELADIGKDGIITPTEKQQIKMTVNDIKSTKKSIVKQCDAYGIVKESVVPYKTYLDSYNSLITMTDSLLSNMSITSSTPSNFNSLFDSYYTALENMTSVIEEASKKYASDVANGIKTDLQEQIDGKIETFYQSTVPTWDASENSKHIGDLWYNTSSTDVTYNSKTYSAKTNYRFNGTSWEENSIVPKDFYDAVDGKSTVYSSIPTTPQDRDLLIPGEDITIGSVTYKKGKVYRYNSSNSTWSEINYTDDTALQEMLESISADNKLSISEKSYLKNKMDEIAKEYSSIQARAEKYSIWNTLTSYQTAYTNLNNYISPLLSKMDEVSTITKSVFDNKFSNYYTELGVANGLIDVAIQSAAESTASKDLNAYKQEVDEFKELVDSNLSLVGVTKVASDYIYSPKIAGGYAYFTKDNYSVEIDPSHSAGNNTLDGYLFTIRDKSKSDSEQVIMSVDTSGKGYFSGEIQTASGSIGGWKINSSSIYKNHSSFGMYGGMYFGTSGLSIGNSFKVTSNGIISAKGSFTTSDSDESVSTKIESGIIEISSNAVGTKGITIIDGSKDKATIRGNYLDFSYNSGNRRSAMGFTEASSSEMGFYLIDDSNKTVGSFVFNNNSSMSQLRCGDIFMENNYYLFGNVTATDGTRLATIGRSYWNNSESKGSNVWIGHYNSSYSGYTNSIYLSAAAVTSYGTVYTPDGTVSKSDARQKTDISNLDINAENFILNLNPVKYKLKHGTSGRYHYGFIAQEVEKNMNETIGDAGIITKSPISIETDDDFKLVDLDDDSTYTYGLRYEEFISPIVLLVQKQHNQIIELKNKIAELERNYSNIR